MFDADHGLITWTTITFGLLLLLLMKKSIFKPIFGFIDDRERRIKHSIDSAER